MTEKSWILKLSEACGRLTLETELKTQIFWLPVCGLSSIHKGGNFKKTTGEYNIAAESASSIQGKVFVYMYL